MEENKAWEEYGAWLLQYIGFKKRGYSSLMGELHNIDFHYSIERDGNRASDGVDLRYIYLRNFKNMDEKGFNFIRDCLFYRSDTVESRACSVLEMLVALADRCEKEYIGDPKSPHPDVIFWEMCCNLGLDEFVNRGFSNRKREKLDEICEIWMDRRHEKNGKGGLFPVKRPSKDHRIVEIWSQMMDYLSENYRNLM